MGGKDKSAAGGRTPQWRFALDLAQPVKMSAGLGNLRLVADGPRAERRNRVQQIAAERCQRIINPRGNGRKYSAGNEPIALKAAQGQGQHALGDAADGAPQLI